MYQLLFLFLGMLQGEQGVCKMHDVIKVTTQNYDAGTIWQGELVRFSIHLTNISNQIVTFGKPVVDCPSCVSIHLPQNTLHPGGQMKADADCVLTEPGNFKRVAAIPFLFPECEPILLSFTGKVKKTYHVIGNWQNVNISHISKKNKENRDKPTAGFSLSELTDLKAGDMNALEVQILGNREHDPYAEGDSITVESNIFRLHHTKKEKIGKGRLYAVLVLLFKEELNPGVYKEMMKIHLGKTLTLNCPVSFRVLGKVWPEQSTINFGVVRRSPVSQNVLIHFDEKIKVWDYPVIQRVCPESFLEAVRCSIVERKKYELLVALTIEPEKIDGEKIRIRDDKFFYFSIVLTETNPDKADISRKDEEIMLHLYGMFLDEG